MATFTAENGYEASFATASTPERQLNAARSFIADGVKYNKTGKCDIILNIWKMKRRVKSRI